MIKFIYINKKYIINFIVISLGLLNLLNVSGVIYAKENITFAVQNQENNTKNEEVANVEVDKKQVVDQKDEGITFIFKMIVLLMISLSIAFIINFILAWKSSVLNSVLDNNALINSRQDILYVNNNEILVESKRV